MKDYWYDKVEVSIFLCSKGSDTPSCAGGAVTRRPARPDPHRPREPAPAGPGDLLRVQDRGLRAVQGAVQGLAHRRQRHRERAAGVVPGEALRPDEVRGRRVGVLGSAGYRAGQRPAADPRQASSGSSAGSSSIAAAHRPVDARRHRAAHREHDAGRCVQPAPRDQHHAAGRRVELLHPAAVPARGGARRGGRCRRRHRRHSCSPRPSSSTRCWRRRSSSPSFVGWDAILAIAPILLLTGVGLAGLRPSSRCASTCGSEHPGRAHARHDARWVGIAIACVSSGSWRSCW